MMMKLVSKITTTFMCIYVFIAKTYAVVCYFSHQKCDFQILFADMVVLCACVFLVLSVWIKYIKTKYSLVWNFFLMVSVIIQIYSGLFNYLIKSQMVDQNIVLWIYDVPCLLSVFLLIITMIKIRNLRKEGSGTGIKSH